MKRMFGTAGIRGVTNAEITPQLVLGIGLAYGDLLCELRDEKCAVGVAHDTRYGAEMLARAAASGLASAGCDVHFYGCVSTGVFSLSVRENRHHGGILITGSHMPPDRIGLIIVQEDGGGAPFSLTDRIEDRYRALERRKRRVSPEDIGQIIEAFHPYELYVSTTVQQIDARLVKSKGYHVLVDPANGTASYVAKQLFEWFGCEVDLINFDPSPVPGRPSEPRAATVGEAIRLTRELGCDLGLCVDVDADRALFLTPEGEVVSEDTAGAIFAREELGKGDVCVTPINSSGLIEQVCRQAGARLEYCPVGQPPTVEAIKESKAVYAYEESGKYYFARRQLWCDGLYSGARMLEIMAKRGMTLAGLAAQFPRFHQVKNTVHVDDDTKDEIMRAAKDLLCSRLTAGRVKDVTVDGFKRCFDDDSWLLLRASGTEPLIRVYSDAPTPERAKELVEVGEEILQEAISRVKE